MLLRFFDSLSRIYKKQKCKKWQKQVQVITANKQLKNEARGEVVAFKKKKK